jgi:hypothetical protein
MKDNLTPLNPLQKPFTDHLIDALKEEDDNKKLKLRFNRKSKSLSSLLIA